MKKVITLLVSFFMVTSPLLAASSRLSPILVPQQIYLDTDGQACNAQCLKELIEKEFYFSFLAKYPNAAATSEDLQELYVDLSILFGLDAQGDKPAIRLAVLMPQKRIRGYAITTVNTIIAYLLHREHHFDIKVFNIDDESQTSIKEALDEIRAEGFEYVIAPVTPEGASRLSYYADGLQLYIPTVNRKVVPNAPKEILFGGIDYEDQIRVLMEKTNEKVALFSDGSVLASSLDRMTEEIAGTVVFKKELDNSRIDFKRMLKGNSRLQNSSIFLNTPLVKSSLLASQLRVYEIEPYVLLSTQINYHPMLLSLTQYEDRQKLLVANVIDFVPSHLRVVNELLGHSIEYDWVNYATSIGIDYFYTHYFNPEATTLFKEMVDEFQVKYTTKLFKAGRYRFFLAEEE